MLNSGFFITVFLGLAFSLTAIAVLISNFHSILNKKFAFCLLSALIWVSSLHYISNTSSNTLLIELGRVNFAAGTLVSYFLFHFANVYPSGKAFLKRNLINVFDILTFVIVGLTLFTDAVSKDEIISADGLITIFGPLYFLYAAHIGITLLFALILLLLKYHSTRSVEKFMIKNLFATILFGVVWVLTTNIILPSVFSIFYLQPFGPAGTIVLIIYVAYSILRHKFLDVRLVVGKSIYYILAAISPYFTYFMIAAVYEHYFGTSLNKTAFLIGVPISLLFVVLFNRLNEIFRNYTDSRLINPGFNPLERLDYLRRQLSNLLNLEDISNTTLDLIAKTIRPAYQSIIIIPQGKGSHWQSFCYKDQEPKNIKDFEVALFFWSQEYRDTIIYDELQAEVEHFRSTKDALKEEILTNLKQNGIKVIVPLVQDKRITGMLLLGEKEADIPYSSQEIKFVNGIADSLALSIGKSMLYEEIQEFNVQLQQRVAEATQELKQKNVKLQTALEKLEDARRQERDMVDVMGHELRTPLSIVRNAILVLHSEFKDKNKIPHDKLKKYLDMAVESVRREVTLLETLLSATKIEGNRIQLTFSKVDMRDVVHDSMLANKYKADEKGITIVFDKPKTAMYAYADRVRTQEIMDNLLGNAVKYTDRGKVTVKLYKEDDFIRLDVIDTGAGIDHDDLAKLGKKFFRAKRLFGEDNISHPSGTGLGLYVSFELIKLMHGKRWIESSLGVGSRFSFALPIFDGQKEEQTVKKLWKMENLKPLE